MSRVITIFIMKLLFIFFSGTGNTQFIAEYIKDKLLKELLGTDYEITLAALDWATSNLINDYDLICLGFPVYAGMSPIIVREYVEKLPDVQNKGLFVYNTKGLAEGIANWHIIRKLEKKGFTSLGFGSFIMPASDEISLLVKKNSKLHKKMLSKNFDQIKKVNKFYEKIIKTIKLLNSSKSMNVLPHKKPVKFFGFLVSGILLVLYELIGNIMRKKLHTDNNCTTCKLCINECPTQNIILKDNQIIFGEKCIFCLRCINNCPEEAIQIGKISIGKARWHGPKSNYKSLRYKNPKTFD